MSYLETLTQHNTDLQGLIDKANTLPDTGNGSNGTSIETCTVTISSLGSIGAYAATVFKDNTISYICENAEGVNTLIVEKVVRNSNFTVVTFDSEDITTTNLSVKRLTVAEIDGFFVHFASVEED